MLQWGHGDEAVEEVLIRNGWRTTEALQWGHGDEAVEELVVDTQDSFALSGFNGATAMKPWKSGRTVEQGRNALAASMGPRR